MKIGILFSNYMYSYIEPFLDLCEKNNIEVDFFKFAHDKVSFEVKAKNKYVINTKWKAKKFDTNKQIEAEIKLLEDRQKLIEGKLASPDSVDDINALSAEYEHTKRLVEQKMYEWEILNS